MAYSIEAAIQTGLFEKVIVSTDSEEYADIARFWGWVDEAHRIVVEW